MRHETDRAPDAEESKRVEFVQDALDTESGGQDSMETLSGETMYGAKGGLPGSGVARNDRCRIEQVDESPKQYAKIVVNAEGAGTVKVHADVMGQRTQGG